MYFVYILYSRKLEKFYIGYTQREVPERLGEHNAGSVSFTSKGIPWEVVYFAAFTKKEDAVAEEKFLKSGKGRERRKYLLASFLLDLKKAQKVEG